jgi:hypothetical protein
VPLRKLERDWFYYLFPLFPFPNKVTICGLLVALSVIVKLPLNCPAKVGLDDTLIAHELSAAMLLPQVLV